MVNIHINTKLYVLEQFGYVSDYVFQESKPKTTHVDLNKKRSDYFFIGYV